MTTLDHRQVLIGDCRILLPQHDPFDLILAVPPCGDTSLAWDRRVDGWLPRARTALKPSGSLWMPGLPRSFVASAATSADAGLHGARP